MYASLPGVCESMCVCVCCMHASACSFKSEDSLQESILSFYYVVIKDTAQVVMFRGKFLYLPDILLALSW